MASGVAIPSSTPLDSSGLPRERSALTMDLDRLDLLLHASSQAQRKLKGKNISDSVLVPLSGTVDAPAGPAVACDPRVLPPTDLGISSNLVPFASKSDPVLPPHESVSAPKSWATIARSPAHPLQFVSPIFEANSSVMQIPNEILAIGQKKFSLCLVGQFMGKPPMFGLIQAMAGKLWGRYGAISVAHYKNGLYIFQFPSDSALSRALFGGPWHIGGIPLLLRKWEANIEPVDFSTSVIPVWVHLREVPLELLTKEGLSYLASAIGTPLHMNQDYSKLFVTERVSLCVNVDFSKPLLEKLDIAFNGGTRSIDVTYSWKPQLCVLCNAWGHHSTACSLKKPSVQWVSKVSVAVINPPGPSTCPITDSAPADSTFAVNKQSVLLPITTQGATSATASVSADISSDQASQYVGCSYC
ncbi:hypothetical protein Tsubulata_036411 [Turnera subulata]|uniref:DUF4283 domain-containing protein n=1 Tax=Turnera subulata TaxID=218843 RepID=A0A9Q0F1B2_9ROSI|nr:hypothetical protein Tsubulata_036411 [Turnera subulata]